MSISCDLIEVPESLLNLFKQYHKAMSLYYDASYARKETAICNLKKIPRKQKHLVKDICQLYQKECDRIKQDWSLKDCQCVIKYKEQYLEEYPATKQQIPTIVNYGKISIHLHLGRTWDLVNYLFCGAIEMKDEELISQNAPIIGINPICYRKHILNSEMADKHYLTQDEVKEVSELMQEFGDDIVYESIKTIEQRRKLIYTRSREDTEDNQWIASVLKSCKEVKNFYIQAASRSSAIVVNID